MSTMYRKINQLVGSGQRYGQACFNALYEYYPDLANEIAGSDVDPFYVEDECDPLFARFWAYVLTRMI